MFLEAPTPSLEKRDCSSAIWPKWSEHKCLAAPALEVGHQSTFWRKYAGLQVQRNFRIRQVPNLIMSG